MSLNPIAAITERITDRAVAHAFVLGTRAVEALEEIAAAAGELALTAKAQRALLETAGHVHPAKSGWRDRPYLVDTSDSTSSEFRR